MSLRSSPHPGSPHPSPQGSAGRYDTCGGTGREVQGGSYVRLTRVSALFTTPLLGTPFSSGFIFSLTFTFPLGEIHSTIQLKHTEMSGSSQVCATTDVCDLETKFVLLDLNFCLNNPIFFPLFTFLLWNHLIPVTTHPGNSEFWKPKFVLLQSCLFWISQFVKEKKLILLRL